MKCGDLRSQVILPAAELLEAGSSAAEAQALRRLAAVLEAAPARTVTDTVKRLGGLELPATSWNSQGSSRVLAVLRGLSTFLKGLGKNPAATDVDLVHDLLHRYAGTSAETFAHAAIQALTSPPPAKKAAKKAAPKPLREDLVERYRRQLEDALGDDPGFTAVHGQLAADPDMGSAEMTLLAQRFSLKKAQGRNAALKAILGRHQALMTSRARSAATAGRIAG